MMIGLLVAVFFWHFDRGTFAIDADDIPPGTVRMGDNFYVDRREVSVLSYREYLYWLQKVFGRASPEYLKALPDTLVMQEHISRFNLASGGRYFNSPVFDDYPVVGITYDQAGGYAQWRSDRVYEQMLIERNIIAPDPMQNGETYFTVEKYLNKIYPLIGKYRPQPYPEYKLPTEDEWERVASRICKANSCNLTEKSRLDTQWPLYNHIAGFQGNVSEMLDQPGLCKGANWFDAPGQYPISESRTYTSAEAWLGFRCVCTWKIR